MMDQSDHHLENSCGSRSSNIYLAPSAPAWMDDEPDGGVTLANIGEDALWRRRMRYIKKTFLRQQKPPRVETFVEIIKQPETILNNVESHASHIHRVQEDLKDLLMTDFNRKWGV